MLGLRANKAKVAEEGAILFRRIVYPPPLSGSKHGQTTLGVLAAVAKRMAGHPPPKRLRISELNPHLLCALCGGYLIDATTIIECLHSFCKTCILRYLETSNYCPICEVLIHKTRPWQNIRLDHALQNAVYKCVPGLFQNEMQRRREFYHKHHKDKRGRVSSSSSKDKDAARQAGAAASAQGDCCSHGQLGDRIIFSKDEKFSISIEFSPDGKPVEDCVKKSTKRQKNTFPQDKRYLHCPAGLRIEHLKKFIRAKFSLPEDIQIDLFYEKDPLCDTYSLMDVAYICMWKRDCVLRLFYSFYEVPPKIPRLDTSVVKLEVQKVLKDGQKTLGEGSEEKASHVKAEEEKQQKKRALTDRKCRTQKEEKQQKEGQSMQEDCLYLKAEAEAGGEEKDEQKDSLIHSSVKVNCSPTSSVRQVKVAEDMEVKVVLEKTAVQKQKEVALVKNVFPNKPDQDTKPTAGDSKLCSSTALGSDLRNQDNPSGIKSDPTSDTGKQEVKSEACCPSSPTGKLASGAMCVGMKRKYSETGNAETKTNPGTLLKPQASSVSKPIQVGPLPCQKGTKPSPKTVQDTKHSPSGSRSDVKGSVPKYSKPASSLKDTKPSPLCQMKKLQVTLTDTKMSPTGDISKSLCAPHNVKPQTVNSQAAKSIANQTNSKLTIASQNLNSVSCPQTMPSVSVALDKKSIPASQLTKLYSSSGVSNSHTSQKNKSSPSQKDAKMSTNSSKDCKTGSSFKDTQCAASLKETKSSSNSKDSKPAVKYTHQSQQTVSYTIVSCGVNGENGNFPSGPNSPKAPLKMLIKSSESKDSKTCFIASSPMGMSKVQKHKVFYPSISKDPQLSPAKTSVGTSTEPGASKQKHPKEKKSRHSESKSTWKPKKLTPKVGSLPDDQRDSCKTEKKPLSASSVKANSAVSTSKNAQDVYNFVPEEKEDMPPKLKEALRLNPNKPSVVKLTVNTNEAHSGAYQHVFPPVIASHTLEPEQSEAVNLSQKPQVKDKTSTPLSRTSSPTTAPNSDKTPAPSNHCQSKVAVPSLSHSSVDNSYTYMYAIDLSKAKTNPTPVVSSADSQPATSVAACKILASQSSQAFPDSQQDLVTTNVENSSCSGNSKKPLDKPQSNRADERTMTHLPPSAAHNQGKTPNKSGVQQLKVSNSLAVVVANLASNAVSNLVTSIKLASSKASSTELLGSYEPSTTTTTKTPVFQMKTPMSDVKTTSITTTSQIPTSSFEPASTETALAKSHDKKSSAGLDNTSRDRPEPDGNKVAQTSPDSTVSLQAPVSTTQTDPAPDASSTTLSEVSSSKVSDGKSPPPSPDVPKTIITVPLLPSQASLLSRARPNDKVVPAQAQVDKSSPDFRDHPRSLKAESSTILPLAEPETSSLATSDSSSPPTVSISSIATSDSPTTVSISLSPNRTFPTNTNSTPVSNDTSSTIISISLPGVSSASAITSTSSTSVTSASTFFSSAAPLNSTESTTTALGKHHSGQLKNTVNDEKTFLASTSRKLSASKGFDSPGKKLEASVSKLLLPKDPRKIDNFLFDTVPGDRESPTSTSSPKPKDILSAEPDEPQSSSFMEDTIISVARGTLPEAADSAPLDSSDTPFTAVHHLPKTISQTSKAYAARKSTALAPNYSSPLPSTKSNKNVIQTTKISTLIPKSSSTTSKPSMYAKAFPYPALNTLPASRAFLHAAFPHASIVHPDFTAMVNGTNNFVRSLIAAQHASRPALPGFHPRPLSATYHLPPKATLPLSISKSQMAQGSPKVSSATSKSTHPLSTKTQTVPKSHGASVPSKSSPANAPSKSNLKGQGPACSNLESSATDHGKSTSVSSVNSPGHSQKEREGKSIKLRAMPPLTIPKSSLGGTTLKLQRSPGSTDHYVLSPTTGGGSSHTPHHNHSQSSEKSKSSKESKRSNSVSSCGSRTPTSPLSPKDTVFAGERQRVPTIKISDINRNPIIVDSGSACNSNPATSTPPTANTNKTKNSCNSNHSHNHRSASASSSSSRPPSASSNSSLSPSSVAHSNSNNIPSPNNSSSVNHRISSRGGDRGSDSSCSPTGSVSERSPARDCRRPPSAEFLLPHHQRWHGFPTAELLFHGFKLPAHAHFQELHYDTDAMPLDYSQSSSKS
ncbi:polycomb complex protein BMI-1 [Elysia marginata]|uniref:Polycomb complex protein BMI-1 n=1 Tax=Elysia marginata TaxID=1093978 RepID=A0AAV4IKI1_9GAST|nr:polycomb complex protein BMI-1 [Elysia marginata]